MGHPNLRRRYRRQGHCSLNLPQASWLLPRHAGAGGMTKFKWLANLGVGYSDGGLWQSFRPKVNCRSLGYGPNDKGEGGDLYWEPLDRMDGEVSAVEGPAVPLGFPNRLRRQHPWLCRPPSPTESGYPPNPFPL